MKSNACINLLAVRRAWKESIAQLHGPLDGTYFVIEFISDPERTIKLCRLIVQSNRGGT